MSSRNFNELLAAQYAQGKFVCVGLDSDPSKLPASIDRGHGVSMAIFLFNQKIVDATHDIACAYKLNAAFYIHQGYGALADTIAYIQQVAPGVPVIVDSKKGDIGNTNDAYAIEAYEMLKADAVTIHPYLGRESLSAFLGRKDKGVFILCHTSNPGAGEFQELRLQNGDMLYEFIARQVAEEWNINGNCGLVVGATFPRQLDGVRQIVGRMPILIPGIGKQGGNLMETVLAGKDDANMGMLINSSREIIFASNGEDFAEVARARTVEMHRQITEYLNR